MKLSYRQKVILYVGVVLFTILALLANSMIGKDISLNKYTFSNIDEGIIDE